MPWHCPVRQAQETKGNGRYLGIDISKDTLDIHRLSDGKHVRFGNDKAGLTELHRWVGKAPVRVVYEATGRYHRDMEGVLDASGHALVKV